MSSKQHKSIAENTVLVQCLNRISQAFRLFIV